MNLHFYKYHGAGNDFILVDARKKLENELTHTIIKGLCNRRFGIGADGLMLLKSSIDFDFEMEYYNADGYIGSMCGNGGRCITAFAAFLGIIKTKAHFIASDGPHISTIDENGLIRLKMSDVKNITEKNEYSFLNTGSPHCVKFIENPDDIDVVKDGREIRFSAEFKPEGTNVNFATRVADGLYIRTYERGVEDETLACGTGSVASAIAYYLKDKSLGTIIPVKTLGGMLEVSFKEEDSRFVDIYLKGPAIMVFEGKIQIQ